MEKIFEAKFILNPLIIVKKHFPTLLLLLCSSISFSQNKAIDSLFTILKIQKEDTNKVKTLNELSWEIMNIGNNDLALNHAQAAVFLSNKTHYKRGLAVAYYYMGIIYENQSKYPEAIKNYSSSLRFYKELGNKRGIANSLQGIGLIFYFQGNYPEAAKYISNALKIVKSLNDKTSLGDIYNNLGLVYFEQGNYPEALKNHFESLKTKELEGDRKSIESSYGNIGLVYSCQGNYSEALKYHLMSLNLAKEHQNKAGIAFSYLNIGNVYYLQRNFSESLINYTTSLNLFAEVGDNASIATCYNNIGITYYEQGKYTESLKNLFKSLKLRETLDNKNGIAQSLCNIGKVNLKLKKYHDANLGLNNALKLSKEIGAKDIIKECYSGLSSKDSATENWREAYENHKMYIVYRDSLLNKENTKKIVQSQMNYDFEKREQATKLQQEKKDAVAKEEIKKQKVVRNSFVGGFALVLLLAGVLTRGYLQKQKANIIITKQKEEVEQKNIEVIQQKKVVEEKNHEITQSIEYALLIQRAILPPGKIVKQYLSNSFILYIPKDIVAGDFYWMEIVDDLVLFAACDCTGHGVPGAMVSVVCHNALNRVVREFGLLEPSKILDKTAELVIENFSKSEDEIKDGMDISFCAYHPKTKILQWAGANNPLWLIRDGELEEIKADKQPIGKFDYNRPFTNHTFNLKQGDSIYIFSDGYADQFGGETGIKKLTRKRFKDLILEQQKITMQEQGTALQNFIIDYRKDVEQIDDILVMGMKV